MLNRIKTKVFALLCVIGLCLILSSFDLLGLQKLNLTESVIEEQYIEWNLKNYADTKTIVFNNCSSGLSPIGISPFNNCYKSFSNWLRVDKVYIETILRSNCICANKISIKINKILIRPKCLTFLAQVLKFNSFK